jgi:hypothetical protein
VYHSQLRAALTFPQSVGVVGGRPGASLYFVGAQDPAAVAYLDPHEVQEVGGCGSAVGRVGRLGSLLGSRSDFDHVSLLQSAKF